MSRRSNEDSIKACYSTWSESYYDEYYGATAAYPPVHRELLKRLLREAGVKNLLDAGCGPASFLRELKDENIELYGFDLTPEMVTEAREILKAHGVPAEHVWEGSVLSPQSFTPPGSESKKLFDAAISIGVLPHIPEEADVEVLENLREAVEPGGLVIVEARNQLFSLFTLNRYSYEFFVDELIRPQKLETGGQGSNLSGALESLEKQFRMDLPPLRKGKADEPGYDEVLSRTHNPLVLKEQFTRAGFRDVRLLFYHFHCLPPLCAPETPELFRQQSLNMENDPEDWRGHFMASAFLVAGRRL